MRWVLTISGPYRSIEIWGGGHFTYFIFTVIGGTQYNLVEEGGTPRKIIREWTPYKLIRVGYIVHKTESNMKRDNIQKLASDRQKEIRFINIDDLFLFIANLVSYHFRVSNNSHRQTSPCTFPATLSCQGALTRSSVYWNLLFNHVKRTR